MERHETNIIWMRKKHLYHSRRIRLFLIFETGIPTNKLSLLGLNVVLGEPVGDGDGGEENGENDDVTVQDDGTIPTDAAVNNMTEKQLKYWIITKFNKKTKSKTAKDLKNELLKLLPNERVAWEAASEEREALKQAALEEAEAKLNELSESYESFRTHGHSCVIKGRLNAFSQVASKQQRRQQ